MERIFTGGRAIGPYTPAIVAGGFCFLSGQGGLHPDTGVLVDGGIKAETEVALQHVASLLAEAGYRMEDIVSMTCYLTDISEWDAMNEVYEQHFPNGAPTRAALAVDELPANCRVELVCVAWRDPDDTT